MSKPVILFACVHNGGRSLAAKVVAKHHGGDRVTVRSAGHEPGDSLNPVVVQVDRRQYQPASATRQPARS